MLNNRNTNQKQMKESNLPMTLIHETDKMSSLEIAELTGRKHAMVMRSIRNMEAAWEKVSGCKFALASYKDEQGKSRPYYELTKTECLYIATKFNDEARAKLVLRWEELETEKVHQKKEAVLSDKIECAKFLGEFLNLNDVSRLIIARKIAEPLGLPLPKSTPSKGILKPATELLKENGFKITVQKFNRMLLKHSVLYEVRRKLKSGKEKCYKFLSGDWLEYGENQVSVYDPRGVQPLYYADKFAQLYNEIIRMETERYMF